MYVPTSVRAFLPFAATERLPPRVRARAPLTRRLARLVDGPPLRRGGPGLPCMQDCWPWDLGIPAPATGNFRSQ